MALIVSLTPVVTVATAILYRTEAVSRDRIAAFSIGVAAVVIVLLPEFDLLDSQVVWWIVLMLIVPITYDVESVYVLANWPEGA